MERQKLKMRLLTNEPMGEDWYDGMARQFKHGMMQEQLDGKVRLGSQIV